MKGDEEAHNTQYHYVDKGLVLAHALQSHGVAFDHNPNNY